MNSTLPQIFVLYSTPEMNTASALTRTQFTRAFLRAGRAYYILHSLLDDIDGNPHPICRDHGRPYSCNFWGIILFIRRPRQRREHPICRFIDLQRDSITLRTYFCCASPIPRTSLYCGWHLIKHYGHLTSFFDKRAAAHERQFENTFCLVSDQYDFLLSA